MAAYAAVVSLFNTLDQIHNHPRFSTSFNKFQIQSLGAHIDFLLDFVEIYNIDGDLSEGAPELRCKIVSAANEAEDIVESHIANLILPESAEIWDVRLHNGCLFGLQRVIGDMESIKENVDKFKLEKKPRNSTSATSSSTTEQKGMVGFEEELMQLMDLLFDQQSSRQTISIVGMGGVDLSMMIGSLPQLEVLKLVGSNFSLPQKWRCVGGEFLRLKFLCIGRNVLRSWTFDDGAFHFPVLEKLLLFNLSDLNEIPSVIGEIPTLQLICLVSCSDSLAISAMKIKKEQEYFGNSGLQIQVEKDN